MNDKTVGIMGFLILLGILAGAIYLFGIGFFCDNTPTHEFYLLGPKGALFYLSIFSLFMYSLWGIMFFFNGPILHDDGNSYSFRPAVWVAGAIWLAIFLSIGYIAESGYGFNDCDYTSCKDKDGKRSELRATSDQMGQNVKCPRCGSEQEVKDFWWRP